MDGRCGGSKEIGLYVHIPFCKSKCRYCDFNSFAGKESLMPAYFQALKREIGYYSHVLKGCRVKTVFLGGGTPSLVPAPYICSLMEQVGNSFDIVCNAEASIESNPGTLDAGKLTMYRAAGINRLSMGLQAWQDGLLQLLGRIHRAEEFVQNLQAARKTGFDNINVDLMFGLPGQSLEEWTETLQNIIRLEVPHVSCYSLKIEEGTVFGDRLAAGKLTPADDGLDREMYHTAIALLKEHGYRHYEISNFTRPGYECRHNLVYWKAEEYLGAGAGAHSYIGGRRYNNVYGLEDYIAGTSGKNMPAENAEEIGREESMEEYMILGLRLIDGVSFHEFEARYGTSLSAVYGVQLANLAGKRLIEIHGGRVKLTDTGLDLANQVFVEFV